MGVMDFFRPAAATTNAGPNNPAGTPANPGTTAASNPSVPSATTPQSNGTPAAIPAAGQGDASPNDKFTELWKADPKQPTEAPSLIPALNLDPTKLMDAAKNVSFVGHITDERLQKAMTDPTELRGLLNEVAQIGFVQATSASGRIIENSMGQAQGVLQDKLLPGAFREQAVSQALATNAVFQNPAVAPLLEMTRNQLMQKYPTASPQEIATLATEYFTHVSQQVVQGTGSQIVTQDQARNNFSRNRGAEPDWEKLLG